jgi:hypothetical protein
MRAGTAPISQLVLQAIAFAPPPFLILLPIGFSKQLPELRVIAVRAPCQFWPLGRFRVGLMTKIPARKIFKKQLPKSPSNNPFGTKRKVVGKSRLSLFADFLAGV